MEDGFLIRINYDANYFNYDLILLYLTLLLIYRLDGHRLHSACDESGERVAILLPVVVLQTVCM